MHVHSRRHARAQRTAPSPPLLRVPDSQLLQVRQAFQHLGQGRCAGWPEQVVTAHRMVRVTSLRLRKELNQQPMECTKGSRGQVALVVGNRREMKDTMT